MKPLELDLFAWGQRARARSQSPIWTRPDGSVRLLPRSPEWGKLAYPTREIHYHPAREVTPLQAVQEVRALRQQYPEALLHGFSPGWFSQHGAEWLPQLQEAGLSSLCWFSGEIGCPSPPAQGWEQWQDWDLPKVATFVYGPEHGWEQIQQRIVALQSAQHLVPLPRAVGDLVVIPGATTDGPRDIEILARCRCLGPSQQRVRASWGALGFKLAQSALAFGADGLGGWGLEEQLAYSGRMRPADLVGEDEALAGVREAGLAPL